MLRDAEADRVADFYRARGLDVRPVDLRLYVTDRSQLGRVRRIERRDESAAVEIDLAEHSLLAELAAHGGGRQRFRVADYNPERIESFHAGSSHRYVLHRAMLEADVVISLPKLKTHEKVGITCALKGFVGAVAHKDCLAHHRFGSPRDGGDEYPDSLELAAPRVEPARLGSSTPAERRAPGAAAGRRTNAATALPARATHDGRRGGTATTPAGAWPSTLRASFTTRTAPGCCARHRSGVT